MWYYGLKRAKGERYEKLVNEVLPFYLQKLEQQAENGFLSLNGRLSWADIYSVALIEYCNCLLEFNLLENYPKLTAVFDNVTNLDGIKKYLSTRPANKIPEFTL
jgi:glutathione S-transferase